MPSLIGRLAQPASAAVTANAAATRRTCSRSSIRFAWEAQSHRQAFAGRPVEARLERERRFVALGDPLDDREAEAAAWNVGRVRRGRAVEAVEYARALARWNARPRVAHSQYGIVRLLIDRDVDASA